MICEYQLKVQDFPYSVCLIQNSPVLCPLDKHNCKVFKEYNPTTKSQHLEISEDIVRTTDII